MLESIPELLESLSVGVVDAEVEVIRPTGLAGKPLTLHGDAEGHGSPGILEVIADTGQFLDLLGVLDAERPGVGPMGAVQGFQAGGFNQGLQVGQDFVLHTHRDTSMGNGCG